jgi:hypothetical protein
MEVKCDRITLCNSKRIERRGTLVANGCICVLKGQHANYTRRSYCVPAKLLLLQEAANAGGVAKLQD